MKYEDFKKEDMEKLTALEKIEWLEHIMKDTQAALEECMKLINNKGW